MADNDKKGPRDISDLKARLGLKNKPGAAPAAGPAPGPAPVPGPAAAPAPIPGVTPAPIPGVAPARQAAPLPSALTGIPAPGAVPPPPGFAPPPEPAPPPPDPRRDPFAAQQAAAAANLAAFYGVGQALPGDASNVESTVKKPTPWPLIGGGIGIGVAALLVGYFCGNISVTRNDYNETTTAAGKIRAEVDDIHKQVAEVAVAVKDANPATGVNFAAIEKMKDLNLQEPDVTKKVAKTNYHDKIATTLFKSEYYGFEPSTVQQLFTYYNDVVVLARQLQVHTMRTLNDKSAIEAFQKANAAGSKAERRLGVILDFSQKAPTSQLVELVGGPICPTAGATDCAPTEMKFGFRTASGGGVSNRPIKGKPQESVFPMQPTELQQQILTGDTNLLAMEAYRRRTKDIVDTLTRLTETEKQLLGNLKKRAEAGKLWTLF